MKYLLSVLTIISIFVFGATTSNAESTVEKEIGAFSKILRGSPSSAIDASKVSNSYCFKAGIGSGGHMTHYAIDPSNTGEDVIDFLNATDFIKAGLDPSKLERHPGKLDTMKPNTLYFLPAGEYEPYHGTKFPFPLIIKSVDLM